MNIINLKKIIISFIVLLFTSVLIYLYIMASTSDLSTDVKNEGTDVPAQVATSRLAKERDLLNPPTASSTEAEKNKHRTLLEEMAVATNTLEIGDCKLNPLAMKVKNGEQLLIKNSKEGIVDISIESKIYSIASNKSVSVVAGFGRGVGLFGYHCNSIDGAKGGLIWVTE